MKSMVTIFGWTVLALSLAGVVLVGGWVAYMRSIDQPAFTLVASDGDIQVRDYGTMTVAEVTTTGNRDGAVRAGFRPLAGYIFARDRQGDKIAMTAPVTQQRLSGMVTRPTRMRAGRCGSSCPKAHRPMPCPRPQMLKSGCSKHHRPGGW
jgi:hypothetical protein